jgi:CRISP-associated protein Cas1
MIRRIVEVAEDRRYLFVSRGFLVVKDTETSEEIGQVPLDDIAAVIGNAHGLSFSNRLLVALSERGAPFVVCDQSHNAVSMLWPVDGNFQQAKRIDAQIAASKPTHKRLWADIVKCKLRQQAAALVAAGAPDEPLLRLVRKVRSGDPENIEAQGARRYWGLLFGPDFRRESRGGGLNGLLNYGYTVMRAATARAVIAAGLHPTIGIHHQNEGNPMRLVDDLMEPFRPVIDLLVWQMSRESMVAVNPETKRILVRSLYDDVQTEAGATPVFICLQRMAVSLAQVYLGQRSDLDLPLPGLPLSLASMMAKD